MKKSLADEIKSKFPNYKKLAEYDFNRCHDLWDRSMYQNNPVFKKVKRLYGNGYKRVTTRQQIIDLFAKKKYYHGYLCALIWGNVGTYSKGKANFEKAFSISHQRLRYLIKKFDSLLSEGKIGNTYDLICNRDTKIKGLGVAFSTKILYFLGEANKYKIQPLIFDRKSVEILNWLYRDAKVTNKAKLSNQHYEDFCKIMNTLSKELDLPSAGYLEAFLFNRGYGLICS